MLCMGVGAPALHQHRGRQHVEWGLTETPRCTPAEPGVGVSAEASQDWPPGGRARGERAGPGWLALSIPLHVQDVCPPIRALLQALASAQIILNSRPPSGGQLCLSVLSNRPCVTGQVSDQGLVILSQDHPRDRPPTPFGQLCGQEALPWALPWLNMTPDPAHCTQHTQPFREQAPLPAVAFPHVLSRPADQSWPTSKARSNLPGSGVPLPPHAEPFTVGQELPPAMAY